MEGLLSTEPTLSSCISLPISIVQLGRLSKGVKSLTTKGYGTKGATPSKYDNILTNANKTMHWAYSYPMCISGTNSWLYFNSLVV